MLYVRDGLHHLRVFHRQPVGRKVSHEAVVALSVVREERRHVHGRGCDVVRDTAASGVDHQAVGLRGLEQATGRGEFQRFLLVSGLAEHMLGALVQHQAPVASGAFSTCLAQLSHDLCRVEPGRKPRGCDHRRLHQVHDHERRRHAEVVRVRQIVEDLPHR